MKLHSFAAAFLLGLSLSSAALASDVGCRALVPVEETVAE